MQYKLEIKTSAKRDIKKLPKYILPKIKLVIDSLAKEPRPNGIKKIKGINGEVYRVRVENYRIIYEIMDKKLIVVVVGVAHRREVYSRKLH